jgi:acyl-CoA thioester hydrolase
MQADLNKYKHKFQVRVRNFEVDSLGIVHNAIYLEYCETGRFEYIRNLGFKFLPGGVIEEGIRVMVKRNEITYYNPARIDELIDVYTRISYIKNSSYCFEHILINPETNIVYCDNKSVQVNLNLETSRPERIDDKYRKLIIDFEGKDIELIND